jgi:hypothetical protein
MFVYQAIRRYLFLMLLSAAAVGAVVQVLTSRAFPIYGGQALIQLGAVDGKVLTKPEIAIAAIDTRSFRQRVLQAMGSPGGSESHPTALIFDSMGARPHAADVIAISARAADEKQLRQSFDAVIRLLDQKEEKRRAQLVDDIKTQIVSLDAYLSNLAKIQESLLAQAKTPPSDPTPLGAVLLLDLTSRNEAQQASVRANRLALQTRLGPELTYPTRLVDDDFQTSQVAGPAGRWRITVLAVAITLLGFMLLALVTGRKTFV